MWDINRGLIGVEILEEMMEEEEEKEKKVPVIRAGPGLASLGLRGGEAAPEASEEGVGLEFSWEIFPWAWMKMTLGENLEGTAEF